MAGPSTGVGGRGTGSVSIGAGGSGDDDSTVGVRLAIDVGAANVAVARLVIAGDAVRRGAASVAVGGVGLSGSAVGKIPGRSQATINARLIQAAVRVKKWPFIFINASHIRNRVFIAAYKVLLNEFIRLVYYFPNLYLPWLLIRV
jgi:hypothetical protein